MNIWEVVKDFWRPDTLKSEFNVDALNELVLSSKDRKIIEETDRNVRMLEKIVMSPKHEKHETKILRKKQEKSTTTIDYNNEMHNVKNEQAKGENERY